MLYYFNITCIACVGVFICFAPLFAYEDVSYIKAGSFQMGSDDGQVDDARERPDAHVAEQRVI